MDGSVWQTVPGGVVTANPVVWRQFRFAALTTSRIRVHITQAQNHSRLTEIEAYTVAAGNNIAPSATVMSPAAGAVLAGPSVPLQAAASDSDGLIAKVDFYADGVLVGTDTTGPSPFTFSWPNVATGAHTLAAVATDNLGATTMSAPVTVTVTPAAGRTNVALASNGGTASASSTFNGSYPASAVINGDRNGLNWGNGGGWNDVTYNAWPDWVEVQFNGTKTIDEIDVFTVQDNYSAPSTPTPSMTFGLYGVRDFEVQYWTGSAWQNVPGGLVTGNTLVWRQFTFPALTTSKIRISVTQAMNHSRLVEIEAYTSEAPLLTSLSLPRWGFSPSVATFPCSSECASR